MKIVKVYPCQNELARDLAIWAMNEPNRIKASKIFRVAERVEARHRKWYGQLGPSYLAFKELDE